MIKLDELKAGDIVKGISLQGTVSIIHVESNSRELFTITYKEDNGKLGQQIIGKELEEKLELVKDINYSFNADPELFRLISEAVRIKLAYIFDPLLAVHTSKIDPLPHQITAVYDIMIKRQPLRFLLADDPGAGKTIMAGLLIKELIARGDVKRCLIIVPGGLAEQWQDELYDKFNLEFEIITRDRINSCITGNPFTESDMVIARIDQLSRDIDLSAKIIAEDWDLIIVDEAHKMAAHFFGGKIKKTKRYKLGEYFQDHTRHLLLLTATPHNGIEEDFQLFMCLLDKDRFEISSRFRYGLQDVDISDIMRRMVKEDILTFEGKKLFPERIAYTKEFSLSRQESLLYKNVTSYVREEFKRAEKKGEKKKNIVGFALTILQRRLASSPEAIYQSIIRRRDRLEKKLKELYVIKNNKPDESKDPFYSYTEEDLQDYDDNPNQESEQEEEIIVDQATTSETIPEFEKEIETLKILEKQALELRNSEKDSKWEALRDLLSNKEMFDTKGFRRKLIIFTEHKDTLVYLDNRIRRLLGKPEAVIIIHGGIRRESRKGIRENFMQNKDISILIATDAAGEGVNLQRANLMINYDIPWNPNRIEQRFGRIHRIGQKEVCFLWNLIAGDTREGDVFKTLFEKLERQKNRWKVFDVLGKVFREKALKDLLIESIRYGDDPDRKIELEKHIDGILDIDHINEVLKQHAIAETSLSKTDIQEIREELNRANARKLQPHFISAFFIEAFQHLNGTIRQREKDRFEILYPVPAIIRQKDKLVSKKILTKYERVCFDKELINIEGKPTAEFLCPGNSLFDSVLNVIIDKYSSLLNKGTILIDSSGKLQEPTLLYYLEHQIDDERKDINGSNYVVSRQLNFVYLLKSGKIISAGYAPYLDFRPPKENERTFEYINEEWIKTSDKIIIDYALTNIIPEEYKKIQLQRKELADKTIIAVKERLTREVNYWDDLANEIREKELSGKERTGFNSNKAREKADELQTRMLNRISNLEKQKQLINRSPIIVGKALIIPETIINGKEEFSDSKNKNEIEKLAIDSVMEMERLLGRNPIDVSLKNFGWDIESTESEIKEVYFIEVKGREKDALTVTITSNEIKTGKNIAEENPNRYVLAIVQIENGKPLKPRYIRNPYEDVSICYDITSINFNIKKLLEKSEDPR